MAFFSTRFVVAFVVFSLISVAANYSNLVLSLPDQFPFLSWSGWTIKDFLERRDCPNVVFLGSSLVLVPIDGIDADYLGRKIDGSQHHHSCYFEDKFKQSTGLDVKSFNFALPGEMPSDAFLIVSNLLKGEKKPEVIIYGLGPRDFLDNLLPSPAATDPFRFLSRFGNIDSIAGRTMPDWADRFSYELGKLFYTYGKKDDLVGYALKGCRQFVDALVPLPKGANLLTYDDRHLLVPEYRPCEVFPGQAMFRPSTAKEWSAFSDNLAEYKKRYAKLKWDTYLTQMEFFADTLACARKRGIRFVVVTMPVTDINRSLLSDLNWNVYRQGVLAMAKRKGATIVDLSESTAFKRSDFMDTVHLHSLGGRKWLDLVVDRLSTNKQVLSALNQGGEKAASKIAGRGGQGL